MLGITPQGITEIFKGRNQPTGEQVLVMLELMKARRLNYMQRWALASFKSFAFRTIFRQGFSTREVPPNTSRHPSLLYSLSTDAGSFNINRSSARWPNAWPICGASISAIRTRICCFAAVKTLIVSPSEIPTQQPYQIDSCASAWSQNNRRANRILIGYMKSLVVAIRMA